MPNPMKRLFRRPAVKRVKKVASRQLRRCFPERGCYDVAQYRDPMPEWLGKKIRAEDAAYEHGFAPKSYRGRRHSMEFPAERPTERAYRSFDGYMPCGPGIPADITTRSSQRGRQRREDGSLSLGNLSEYMAESLAAAPPCAIPSQSQRAQASRRQRRGDTSESLSLENLSDYMAESLAAAGPCGLPTQPSSARQSQRAQTSRRSRRGDTSESLSLENLSDYMDESAACAPPPRRPPQRIRKPQLADASESLSLENLSDYMAQTMAGSCSSYPESEEEESWIQELRRQVASQQYGEFQPATSSSPTGALARRGSSRARAPQSAPAESSHRELMFMLDQLEIAELEKIQTDLRDFQTSRRRMLFDVSSLSATSSPPAHLMEPGPSSRPA